MENLHETLNKKSLISSIKLFFKKLIGSHFREILKNRLIFWFFISSILVNIINWGALLIFIKPVDETIILHYNVYFGVDMIGNWRQVFLLPSIGLGLLIINVSLASYFYSQKERIASHLLMIASLMAQLSLLVASISVIIINY